MRACDIDLHEFLHLDVNERLEIIDEYGVPLSTFATNMNQLCLYRLSSFYVETKESFKIKRVLYAIPFIGGPRLDKYLESINLNDLLINLL